MSIERRDYEWYEARAQDVKLADIASSQENAEFLQRLRDDDSHFLDEELRILEYYYSGDGSEFLVEEGDDLGWLGYFIGKSERVKTLGIDYLPGGREQIVAFFEGFTRNQSIHSFECTTDLGNDTIKMLTPFFRNNKNLDILMMRFVDIGREVAREFGLALGGMSLTEFHLQENNLSDEGLKEIAIALSTHTRLEELHLDNIDSVYCLAMKGLLTSRASTLKVIDFSFNNMNDEGMELLVAGMMHCCDLSQLSLSYNTDFISAEGWRSLSKWLQSDSCRLEELSLCYIRIDDIGAIALAQGLTCLQTLKRLDLYHNSFGDEGLRALEEAMTNCGNLTWLNLSSIKAAGLRALATFFQSKRFVLKSLAISGIDFGDEEAAALAGGLRGNTSLTHLGFSLMRGGSLTATGWSALSRLVCDPSSINSTYLSNHTLKHMFYMNHGTDTPSDIKQYLKLNEHHGPRVAAILKILLKHRDFDMKPFFQWKLKFLPLVIDWFDRANSSLDIEWYMDQSADVGLLPFALAYKLPRQKLSAMYKFIRGVPMLVIDSYQIEKLPISKKRKLG